MPNLRQTINGSGVAGHFVWCGGGGKNTKNMSFIYTFYFFINLDKILRSTQLMGKGAISP